MKKTVFQIKYRLRLTDPKTEIKYAIAGNTEGDAMLNFLARYRQKGYRFDNVFDIKPLFEVNQTELFE